MRKCFFVIVPYKLRENKNNIKVNVNYGSSGTLKTQIENGAEVCAYFSANEKFMDELVEENDEEQEEEILEDEE